MNTFWVTFYSYKGGVGRTMALANVAALLAKEGRRVLLIDFDLEAPGLDAFDQLGCAKGHPGVVEYVSEYLASGKAPAIKEFVRECIPQTSHLRGKLWLMPSGKKDLQYNRDRAEINWTALYDCHDGERFINNWKADIERTYKPDYVLIDSRTGLTDVGGICTLHLPQLVVLLYSLNDQNIHGIAGVARAVSKAENPRPPQFLTVASPVPPIADEKGGILQERLALAEKELGIKPQCQLHYDARVPLKEVIFSWSELGGRLLWEYQELKKSISRYDVRGIDFLITEAEGAIKALDEERAMAIANDLKNEYGNRPESFYQIAQVSRAFGENESVESNLRKAIDLDPYFSPAFDDLISLFKVKKRWTDAISLCVERLKALGDRMELGVTDITLTRLGELSMATEQYRAAVDAFGKLPHTDIAYLYNYNEARRRAGEKVSKADFQKVITLYEQGAATEGASSLAVRLNKMQAMHIPYALTGDIDKARHLLLQFKDLASTISFRERFFSVKTYLDMPAEELLKHNKEMLSALNAGKLWDGTLL